MMESHDESHEEPEKLGLGQFSAIPDDSGMSLEELSKTYAELLSGGADPYQQVATEPRDDAETSSRAETPNRAETRDDAQTPHDAEPESESPAADGPAGKVADAADETDASDPADDESCRISPRTILEAMLFIGHPENEPLTSKQVASLMRGVRPNEIDDLIAELNEQYRQQGCPYTISSVGSGYRMELSSEFSSVRDAFYGRVKEARLSQSAVDVLALVAWNQGLTRDEVDQIRNKPSGGVLSQLVRRGLLRIERSDGKPRIVRHFTTDRFLELFRLESLESLPQTHDLDRYF